MKVGLSSNLMVTLFSSKRSIGMDKTQLANQLRASFPIFSQHELAQEIAEKAQWAELPVGVHILEVGHFIKVVPLVLSGSIKVVRENAQGNEIFLYYIGKGESCAMTLSACLRREKSAIKAIVESDAQVLALPVEAVYDFVRRYPSWNEFMAATYALRFQEILDVVDSIAFQSMDVRLLKYLLEKSHLLGIRTLTVSRTAVAKDLNSSREVVSRLLKQMASKGIVNMTGNQVEMRD